MPASLCSLLVCLGRLGVTRSYEGLLAIPLFQAPEVDLEHGGKIGCTNLSLAQRTMTTRFSPPPKADFGSIFEFLILSMVLI